MSLLESARKACVEYFENDQGDLWGVMLNLRAAVEAEYSQRDSSKCQTHHYACDCLEAHRRNETLRLLAEIAILKKERDAYKARIDRFLETMEGINEHLGYPFTQVLMSFRLTMKAPIAHEALAKFGGGE